MPSQAGPAELLADLARELARLQVPWYVFGAQAVLIWGRPRLTTDVDVTVRLGDIDASALVSALQECGFGLRILATPEFVQQTRVLPLVHSASGLAVDVVLAGPGLEDEFLARAVVVDIDGMPIPVISAEDLIVTKILAGRSKDIDDIRGVLAERGDRVDVGQVRRTLGILETALGQSDLLPIFDDELKRSRAPSHRP
ncbi:MAG: nucleotidyltransferase [Acidobacteria bacterium]|nr:nucleotidyltransferase [Acidobacteriota bacterium]